MSCSCLVLGQDKPDATAKPVAATVSGQILMPDGSPAVDVDVHLLRRANGAYTLPVKTEKAQTDQEGSFRFQDVSPGRYKVWGETPKLTTLEKKLGGKTFSVDQSGQPVKIEPIKLHEGCNYHVKVLSAETGQPLTGGRVWFGWTDLPREYHADKDGIVRIGGLGVDDWYFVVAADGHGIVFRKIPKQPLGSTTELEFKLQPGGDIVGVVETDEGTPVEGARVYASSTEGGMLPSYGRQVTGKDGRFTFRNIPAGVAVRISPGKEDHDASSELVVIANGRKRTEVKVRCNPRPYGGDCIVSVFDEDGNPIVGAELQNPGNSTAKNRRLETGADGSGHLKNLFSSLRGCRVFVRAEGFITQEVSIEAGTAENPSRKKVTMLRGKTLKGQLLEPDGSPASGIRVYYNEGEHPWSLGGRVLTEKDGTFQISGLPTSSTLTVYTPRKFSPIRDLPVTAGLAEPIKITMQLAAVITVRAIDKATGKPIPEFNVRIHNSRERQDDEPRASFSTSYSEQGVNVLGKQTEFKMEHLKAGTPLQLTVSAHGYQPKVLPRVVAVRSDQAERIDVALEAESPKDYHAVAGRLVMRDGKPAVGVIIKLVVGKVRPSLEPDQRRDSWDFYRWDTLASGQIARSDRCLQFLSTATDANGKFSFPRVRRDGPWIELLYIGNDQVASARHPDLRKTHSDSLDRLDFTPDRASTLKLFLDRKKWDEAHAINLESLEPYEPSLTRPFSSIRKTLQTGQEEVKFTGLPAGNYQVRLEGKPIPRQRNGFTTRTIGTYFFELPAGEDMEGDL